MSDCSSILGADDEDVSHLSSGPHRKVLPRSSLQIKRHDLNQMKQCKAVANHNRTMALTNEFRYFFLRHSDQAEIVNAYDDEEIRDGVKRSNSCRISVPYRANDKAVSHPSSGPQRESVAPIELTNKKTRS